METKGKIGDETVNVLYPSLKEIEIACRLISNGVEDVTPIMPKEDINMLKSLCIKWILNYNRHKDYVISEMIKELS